MILWRYLAAATFLVGRVLLRLRAAEATVPLLSAYDGGFKRTGTNPSNLRTAAGAGLRRIPRSHRARDTISMKKSVLYERDGRLFLRTRSKTTDGLWMDDGPCTVISASEQPGTIGAALLEVLSKSNDRVAPPKSWDEQSRPLLDAAGVASWAEFRKGAKCVAVTSGEEIQIRPSLNEGERGFVPLKDDVSTIPVDSDRETVGRALATAIERSR